VLSEGCREKSKDVGSAKSRVRKVNEKKGLCVREIYKRDKKMYKPHIPLSLRANLQRIEPPIPQTEEIAQPLTHLNYCERDFEGLSAEVARIDG